MAQGVYAAMRDSLLRGEATSSDTAPSLLNAWKQEEP